MTYFVSHNVYAFKVAPLVDCTATRSCTHSSNRS